MMSKEDQVPALLEFTSSREEMSKETNKYKVLWGRTACPGPGRSGELFGSIMNLNLKVSLIKINKVSLKLRSNYIFMHPYEYISLRKG